MIRTLTTEVTEHKENAFLNASAAKQLWHFEKKFSVGSVFSAVNVRDGLLTQFVDQ